MPPARTCLAGARNAPPKGVEAAAPKEGGSGQRKGRSCQARGDVHATAGGSGGWRARVARASRREGTQAGRQHAPKIDLDLKIVFELDKRTFSNKNLES